MAAGLLGMIATPAAGNAVAPGVDWCADNGCYRPGRYPGDAGYLRWLAARADRAHRCAFATAPDIVADAHATLTRALPMLEPIRAAGYPAALVAQDGLENLPIPWDRFDALFLVAAPVGNSHPPPRTWPAKPANADSGCTWDG